MAGLEHVINSSKGRLRDGSISWLGTSASKQRAKLGSGRGVANAGDSGGAAGFGSGGDVITAFEAAEELETGRVLAQAKGQLEQRVLCGR